MLLLLCQETADIMFPHMEQHSALLWNSLSIKKQTKITCSEINERFLGMWKRCFFPGRQRQFDVLLDNYKFPCPYR